MAPQSAAIRRAGRADARAIAEVVVEGWRAAYRGLVDDDFLDGLSIQGRQAAWSSRLENDPDGLLAAWLAEDGGRAVGFIGSGPPHDPDVAPSWAEVYSLYLLPEAWHRGLGERLLDAAAEHWHERDARTLVLWVLEANTRARGFYESQGWSPDGARRELPLGGENVSEVRYRLVIGR